MGTSPTLEDSRVSTQVKSASSSATSCPCMSRLPPRELGILPVPTWLRQGRAKLWSWNLTLLLAFGTTVTVAAQYYSQPLLVELAQDFGVSETDISAVPTLTQAGNAAGFLFLAPLGDLVKRRQLILIVITMSMPILVGLALSPNAETFKALSFLLGFLTITPQVNGPLILDYAPPQRRSTAVSLNVAGILFGITAARTISGVITHFSTWSVAFWVAFGLQGVLAATYYLCLPDYPQKDHGKPVTYQHILYSLVKSAATEPALVQLWLLALLLAWVNISTWSTISFLLDGVYSYNTLQIGLFGLAGLLLVFCAPLVGHVVDLLAPWYAIFFGFGICIAATALYTAAGGLNLAALIVYLLLFDLGAQLTGVGFVAKIATIDPLARSRHNAVYMLANLIGGFTGTQASSYVLLKLGWSINGAQWMGVLGLGLLVCFVRGPHVPRHTWFGWKGGWAIRRQWCQEAGEAQSPAPETTDLEQSRPQRESGKDSGLDSDKSDSLILPEAGQRTLNKKTEEAS